MDHLLEMIAAWEPAHVLAPHRGLDVAVQQQPGEESDLVDVVALLPATHSAPRDFVRRVKEIERVGCDAPPTPLMGRDAEIAEQANGATRSREPVGGRQLGDTRLLLRGMAFDQVPFEFPGNRERFGGLVLPDEHALVQLLSENKRVLVVGFSGSLNHFQQVTQNKPLHQIVRVGQWELFSNH